MHFLNIFFFFAKSDSGHKENGAQLSIFNADCFRGICVCVWRGKIGFFFFQKERNEGLAVLKKSLEKICILKRGSRRKEVFFSLLLLPLCSRNFTGKLALGTEYRRNFFFLPCYATTTARRWAAAPFGYFNRPPRSHY